MLFLWLTMLLSGLWHGANITFVIWGAVHALFLTLERFYSKVQFFRRIPKGLLILITFIQASIAWVFFRAEDWDDALKVIKGMFGFTGIVLPEVLRNRFNSLDNSIKFDDVFFYKF